MIGRQKLRTSTKRFSPLLVIVAAALLLAACAPAAAPASAPVAPTAAPVQPTTAAALPAASSIKVGLVTAVGGVDDQAFNQLAWQGIQKAAAELGFQAKLLESGQPAGYATNIDALASAGFNVIITVGASMGDVTASKARQYPGIRFAIVDYAYAGGGPANVTSLMFAEDQVGFLAGVLAAGMSKSGFVCSVSSVPPPQSDRAVISFRAGAVWQAGADIQTMNNYINIQTTNSQVPAFTDPTQGKETAQKLIGAGCDVVFAVGGSDVSGVLQAAAQSGLPAIGAGADQYNLNPDVRSALLSSAMKNVDVAVYTYLKAVSAGSAKPGVSIADLQNGGVGLAPFHDWDSKVPPDLQARLQTAAAGLKDGSIKMDLP